MTAWTTLGDALFAVGEPITSSQGLALRDNPIALSEGDTDAPVNRSGWHPYDKVTNGDANDGLIYDFSVSGAVANVVTPDFEDGYEYQIVFNVVSHSDASTQDLRIELYRETTAAYATAVVLASVPTATIMSGFADLVTVRAAWALHLVRLFFTTNSGFAPVQVTAQKILRARLSFAAGNFASGKIHLYRRLAFYS